MSDTKLKPYIVEYTITAEGPQVQFFKAHAEDAGHAEEQCLDAHPTGFILDSYQEPKPYVVRLSLPLEAISIPAAIETFLDMAKTESWVFQVSNGTNTFVVDTRMEDGRVKECVIMACLPNETDSPEDSSLSPE